MLVSLRCLGCSVKWYATWLHVSAKVSSYKWEFLIRSIWNWPFTRYHCALKRKCMRIWDYIQLQLFLFSVSIFYAPFFLEIFWQIFLSKKVYRKFVTDQWVMIGLEWFTDGIDVGIYISTVRDGLNSTWDLPYRHNQDRSHQVYSLRKFSTILKIFLTTQVFNSKCRNIQCSLYILNTGIFFLSIL
jgi:hypothetical protein